MKKTRIDKLLLDKGLVRSSERARALIMAGDVLVDDEPVVKAGASVDPECNVRLRRPPHPFASRGGIKLQGALEAFKVDPEDLVCMDIGASTGGFTDCLLVAGSRHVYAVDVDTSQLDWKLRSDIRVTPVEGNARYFESAWISEAVDLVTIDLSFISLGKVLPVVSAMLAVGARCLALVKPQFELRREEIGKGGIVSDSQLHEKAVVAVVSYAEEVGFVCRDTCPSPITGKRGNREFFVYLEKI